MAYLEKLMEGKYNYFAQDKLYSEEVFSLQREEKSHGNFIINSQTLTRTRTGEFLKVDVEYNFTQKYETNYVTVTCQMGPKESVEKVKVNSKEKSFVYSFEINNNVQKQNMNYNSYVFFATPCFVTSMLMTQMKKIDPVHRTQYGIYTSSNIWSFEQELISQDVYVELQELEASPLNIGGNELKASHCKLLQVDTNGTIANKGHDIFLSKYHSIPYKGVFEGGIVIEMDRLKNFEKNLAKHL